MNGQEEMSKGLGVVKSCLILLKKGRTIRIMEELLKNFSPVEIILCTWLITKVAIEVVEKFDWGKERIRKIFDSDYKAQEKQKRLEDKVGNLEKFYEEKKRVDDGFAHLKDVDEKILGELSDIKDTLNEHIRVDDERNADSIRAYILRFNMELVRGILHTREDFIEVLSKIDEYERYCRSHKDYRNNRAVSAISNIKRVYGERLEKRDFL